MWNMNYLHELTIKAAKININRALHQNSHLAQDCLEKITLAKTLKM